MNEVKLVKIEEPLKGMQDLIIDIIANFAALGDIMVTYLDNGGSLERAHELTGVHMDTLSIFEDVGRKLKHPNIIMIPRPSMGMRRLEKCSFSEQGRYSEPGGRVSLVVIAEKGTNEFDTRLVHVDDLNNDQCSQVFSGKSIRDAAAQIVWIEGERSRKASEPAPRHVIDESSIKAYLQAGGYTRKELRRILKELDALADSKKGG